MAPVRRPAARPEPKEASSQGRLRLQLDFSPDAYRRLQELKELGDARNNAEVIRKALQLYEWFLKKKNEGVAVQAALPDGTVEKLVIVN